MPAAFPYYLECFPNTVPFLGADWLGSLTGRGVDPGGPFVIARYMYPDGLSGGAMAAPAHVQGYAEGGVLYSMICVGVIGMLITAVSALSRKSRESAIWHAAYIQGLVAIYYSSQTSFRGIVWHSYGVFWAALPLGLLMAGAFQTRLSPVRSIIPRAPASIPPGGRVHAEVS
ncbi:MAG: hypothetical protein DMF95_33340 [Acidobacteria bacterium]|nr:MAG: hypothetical protein DMF95_33340 [Acidobacteriota bacterium]